ncbi:MAG: FG-GAP-like repeat-containing protein [Polyangiales bacterium]
MKKCPASLLTACVATLAPAAASAQVYALECNHAGGLATRAYVAAASPCVLNVMNDAATTATAQPQVTVGGVAIPVDGLAVDRAGRVVAFEFPDASGAGSRMVTIDPRTGAATRVGTALDLLVFGATFDLDDRLWVVGTTPTAPRFERVFAQVNPTTGAGLGTRPYTGDIAGPFAQYIPAMDIAALPQGGLAVLDSDSPMTDYDRVATIDVATGRTTLLRALGIPASLGGFSLGMTFTNRLLYGQALVFDGDGTDDILLASLCGRLPTTQVLAANVHPQNAGLTDMAAPLRPSDDDGDGVQSRFERSLADSPCAPQRDTDGDGLPDLLDPDDDGDGALTADEAADPNRDGDPADARDTDADRVPDWLDNKDLVATLVTATGTTDAQTLAFAGSVTVTARNQGVTPVAGGFAVTVFRDVNGDGAVTAGTDVALGSATVGTALAAGATAMVTVTGVSTTLGFRAEPLYAMVDSADAVRESREDNNVARTGADCVAPPTTLAAVALREEWSYGDGASVSQVTVVDLDGNGTSEVVVPMCPNTGSPDADYLNASIRVLDGATGRLLRTSALANLNAGASIAVGDIDNDGRAEIVALDRTNRVVVLEDDLTVKWTSAAALPALAGALTTAIYGAPTIADLDGDGTPEVFVGATVFDATGRQLWSGTAGRGYSQRTAGGGFSLAAIAADVDLDGRQEVIAGNTAYRADGSILWQANAPDGMTAVGNFDADPYPEVVLSGGARVILLDHDGTVLWSTAHAGGMTAAPVGNGATFLGILGSPVVANVDGDPQPEVGVAGSSRFVMFDGDGTVLWQATTNDSSAATGATAFDFNGDGRLELVYGDEFTLFVWNGADGRELLRRTFHNATALAYPTVADVDQDGSAEILVATYSGFGWIPRMQNGVYAFGADTGRWRGARAVLHQQPYSVNNVSDVRGTIPRRPFPSWLDHNTYRCQQPTRAEAAAGDGLADVTASFLRVDRTGLPASAGITARIGNGGRAPVPAGTRVAFYTGDPRVTGTTRIGVATLSAALLPGRSVDVTVTWMTPPPLDGARVWVAADDDGSTAGAITSRVVECDERNNEHDTTLRDPLPDAGVDAAMEASVDAAMEASVDAAMDSAMDAAADAMDAAMDAASDAPDAAVDAAMDSAMDAMEVAEVGADASEAAVDASADAADAAADIGMDAAGRELVLYQGGGCGCAVPGGERGGSNGAPVLALGLAAVALTRRRRPPHER